MRAAWLLLAATGCRSILGIDSPEHTADAAHPLADSAPPSDGPASDGPLPDAPPGAPTFVQAASKTEPDGSSIDVAFTKSVTAGDLIVVAVGVTDGNTPTFTVTDSLGGLFQQAVPPTTTSVYTATMWYGFARSSNTDVVTVQFGGNGNAVGEPDLRIAEYRGVSQLALVEVQTGNTGSSDTPSATLTTQSANALLVAADYSPAPVNSAGTGFDQRILSNPYDCILEDRIAITPGGYTATATLTSPAPWVMQLAAFSP